MGKANVPHQSFEAGFIVGHQAVRGTSAGIPGTPGEPGIPGDSTPLQVNLPTWP